MMMKLIADNHRLVENSNKYLIYLYVLSCALGLVSCIFFAVAWSHWHSTLNTCFIAPDCGCILYVSTTLNVVAGGDIRVCYFVTYSQLAVVFVSFCMACYYCARSVKEETRRHRTQGGKNRRYALANRDIQIHSEEDEETCLTPIALSSGLVSVLLLSNAYMYTEGYFKTCSQYRRTVGRSLKASGNLVSLVYERFSCSTVLDTMDYTHPNTPRRDPRGGIINSAILLQGAMLAAWVHFLVWLLLLAYNTFLARKNTPTTVQEKNITVQEKSIEVLEKSKKEENTRGIVGAETSI